MADLPARQDTRTKIFISYSRRDSSFVEVIRNALLSLGYEVLVDRQDIEKGEDFWTRIQQLIAASDSVLFVISPDSIASRICNQEVELSKTLGKRLIPLVWRAVKGGMPESLSKSNWVTAEAYEQSEMADEAALASIIAQLNRAINLDDLLWVREHTGWILRAAQWEKNGRQDGMVLRSDEITVVQSWASRRPKGAPEIPHLLVEFINASVTRERRDRRRTQILQRTIGTLVLFAGIAVALGGLGVTRLMSGIGERTSRTTAALSRESFYQSDFESAARFALAGMNGHNSALFGFSADLSEEELTAAVLSNRRVALLAGNRTAENRGRVESLALSPDGRFILTSSEDPIARLWDAESGVLIREFAIYDSKARNSARRVVDPESEDNMDASIEAELPSHAVFSKDGTRVATARGSVVHVFDTQSGRLVTKIHGEGGLTGAICSIEISPDGTTILTGSLDNTARLWSVNNGTLLKTLNGHTGYVELATYSPSGMKILTVSDDQTARIWDAKSGRLLRTLVRHHGRVFVGAFSHAGDKVVTGGDGGEVFVWDVKSGKTTVALMGHSDFITSAVFSKDGLHVLTASTDSTAKIWNSKTGELERNLSEHRGTVLKAAYSIDSKLIVTASSDKTARMWDAATGTLLAVLAGHGDEVNAALFSDDGLRVFTVSDDRTARIWSTAVGAPRKTLAGLKGWADFVGLSFDGRRVFAVTNSEHSLSLWDRNTGSLLHTFDQRAVLPNGSNKLRAPAFSPRAARVLILTEAGVTQLWDTDSLALLHTFKAGNEAADVAMFSPDGQLIVTGCDDGMARMWEAATGRQVSTLSNGKSVEYLAFSTNGKFLMVSGEDGPVRVWNVQTPRDPKEIARLPSPGGFGIFSPNGLRLLLLSGGVPRIWDIAASRSLHEFVHANDIYSSINYLDMSSDGRLVVTASDDSTARIWNADSGALVHILAGHSMRLTGAIFSRNNGEILSISNDGTLRLWDTATGALLQVFRGHWCVGVGGAGTITSLDLSRDGRAVVTGGIDKTVRVWEVPMRIPDERALVAKACSEMLRGSPSTDHLISLSVLTAAERKAAPAISPTADFMIEGDVCTPVPLWRRVINLL